MVRKKITLNEAQLKRIISEAVMTAMQGQMPQGDENPFANVGNGTPKPAETFARMNANFLNRFNTAKETVDQILSANPGLGSKFAASKEYRNLMLRLVKSKQETLKILASAANKNKVNEGNFNGGQVFGGPNLNQKMVAQLNVMVGGYITLAGWANRFVKGGHMTQQQVVEPLGRAYKMVENYLNSLKSMNGGQGQAPQPKMNV